MSNSCADPFDKIVEFYAQGGIFRQPISPQDETFDSLERKEAVTEIAETIVNGARWAQNGDLYTPCSDSINSLPAGQYVVAQVSQDIVALRRTNVILDDLVTLPDSPTARVITEIERFWGKKEHFKALGFVWKRGILMHGPPGSGKTSTVQLVSRAVIQRGGIALYASDISSLWVGLSYIRMIEPERPVVVMMEDLECMVRSGENVLLSILDGELQVDNVVYVATTNHPEKLGARLTNRPSRFDLVIEVPMPSAVERLAYFQSKLATIEESKRPSAADVREWVAGTEGFAYAHLKEVLISVLVFEVPFREAERRLRGMAQAKLHTNDGKQNETFGEYR